jgi:hypothetical protein
VFTASERVCWDGAIDQIVLRRHSWRPLDRCYTHFREGLEGTHDHRINLDDATGSRTTSGVQDEFRRRVRRNSANAEMQWRKHERQTYEDEIAGRLQGISATRYSLTERCHASKVRRHPTRARLHQ